MKQIRNVIIVLSIFSWVTAAAQDLSTAQRFIKVGNSLREAHQYEQSETYLAKGLKIATTLKNVYWQAVAYENLALLLVDMEDISGAANYFRTALRLYESQKMNLSAKVIRDMMNDHNIQQDNTWQLYGGIEVGSKGVKYSIIRVRRSQGRFSFVSVKNASKNTQIIDFTPDAISETATAVRSFLDTITNSKYKVAPENIFIAVSSGVKQEADKIAGAQEKVTNALRTALSGKYARDIKFLTPCEEGDLSIRGIIPGAYLYTSSLVDVGSGNTKGGYLNKGENTATCFSIPWGTSTLSKKLSKQNAQYTSKFFADSVKSHIVSEIARKPGLSNRKTGIFSGGIFWAMCNYLYPEKINDDFVEFTRKDVDRFFREATTNYNALINPDLSRIADDEVLSQAKKEISASQSTFTEENILAGSLLVKGIITEMDQTGFKGKKYHFARYGSVGWISGYIVQKLSADYNKVVD